MPPSDYLPVLTEPDWKLRDTCLWRPLVAGDQAPGVALARLVEGKLKFLSTITASKMDRDQASAEAEAVANLVARGGRPEWVESSVAVAGQPVSLLTRRGDQWTASDLLDAEELRAVQEHLGCAKLVLAVPHRGLLVAAGDAAAITAYLAGLAASGQEGAEKPISNRLLLADQGQLQGLYVAPPANAPVAAPRVVRPGTPKARAKTPTLVRRTGATVVPQAAAASSSPSAPVASTAGLGRLKVAMVFLWLSCALYTLLAVLAIGVFMANAGSEEKHAEFYQFMGIFMGFPTAVLSGLHWRALLGLRQRRHGAYRLACGLIGMWIISPLLPLAFFLLRLMRSPEVAAHFPPPAEN